MSAASFGFFAVVWLDLSSSCTRSEDTYEELLELALLLSGEIAESTSDGVRTLSLSFVSVSVADSAFLENKGCNDGDLFTR
jgi:hypothetical protein